MHKVLEAQNNERKIEEIFHLSLSSFPNCLPPLNFLLRCSCRQRTREKNYEIYQVKLNSKV